jgi:hypothetical protein
MGEALASPNYGPSPLKNYLMEWMETHQQLCPLLLLPQSATARQIMETVTNLKEQLTLLRKAIPDWAERLHRYQEEVKREGTQPVPDPGT